MNARRAAGGFGLAVIASQAGHLIAYQVRFGAAAQQIQASGAHSYFPALAKSLAGVAAMGVLASLLIVGLAKALAGERREKAPALLPTVAILFTLQLAVFIAQELIESKFAGIRAGPGFDVVLWGTIGQLPAALGAAVALRWLASRVAPAVAALSRIAAPDVPAPHAVLPLRRVHVPLPCPVSSTMLTPVTRRGPPASYLLRTDSV